MSSFMWMGPRARPLKAPGTEDYFNDAWSLREAQGNYTGVPIAEGTGMGSRMSAYRWHLPDPVPFRSSLRFEIEHAGWTYDADGNVRSGFEERADLFSSVAYWYQLGIAQGLTPAPYGVARLPQGNARQIEAKQSIQGHQDRTRATPSVQKEVFWSRDLLLFEAEGPGAWIEIPFDVAEDARYELLAQVAHSPDYGTYTVLLDGKPLAQEAELEHEPGANVGAGTVVNAYHSELYVAEDHVLGWPRLTRGQHAIRFVCTGKDFRSSAYHLGIDTLVLAKVASPETVGGEKAERLRSGPASRLEWAQGLQDPDPYVREAAAWRATQDSALAGQAIRDLARAFSDSDTKVRGLAVAAFRPLGDRGPPRA